MKQNFKKFTGLLLILLVNFLLVKCTNDEQVNNNKEIITNVKNDLKLNKFSNSNIADNVVVDFDNVKEFEKDSFKISEIPAKEKNASFLKSNFLQSQLKYQVITIDYENKSYSYLLEIYAHKSSAVYLGTITKLKDFSGTFNVYSFEGENLGSIGVSKGVAKNISEKEDLNILTKAINLFSDKSNLTNRIPPCDRPAYVPMQYVTDYYQEVLFDGKPLSYIWVRQELKTIQVLVTYPCDSPADVVARNYVAAILNDHGAGGGSSTNLNVQEVIIVSPNRPISNMTDYLKCFLINDTSKVTIYADQPQPNSSQAYTLLGDVGHSFITIEQGNNKMTFGFYPNNGTGAIGSVKGIMGNDDNHSFDVSISMTVTPHVLSQIISQSILIGNDRDYSLYNSNCTDVAISIAKLMGIDTGDCYGDYLLAGGSNPGRFGEVLRTVQLPFGAVRNTFGGSAPINNKTCN